MAWTKENKLVGVIPLPEADCFAELRHRNQPSCSETTAHHVSVHMPPNSRGSFVGSDLHDSLNLQPPAFYRVMAVLTCSVTLRPQTMTLYQGADIT